jgi:NAD(P)-dependent dehydrogenase (short-subunit alcohol dehydrogenase family)
LNRADKYFRGLGALICEKFAAEGANIVVNYVSSKDRADQVAEKCKEFGVKTAVIQAVRTHSSGR